MPSLVSDKIACVYILQYLLNSYLRVNVITSINKARYRAFISFKNCVYDMHWKNGTHHSDHDISSDIFEQCLRVKVAQDDQKSLRT